MNIYEHCPTKDSPRFTLRPVRAEDCADLLKVYSDPAAVPLFNGDNCNGDDFHYTTAERMRKAIDFWIWSYDNGWFVRWSIVDKHIDCSVGTVELCLRDSEKTCILRLDLRSDYENEDALSEILPLVVPEGCEWFGVGRMLTKAVTQAAERIRVLTGVGFRPGVELQCGDGTCYGDYYEYDL